MKRICHFTLLLLLATTLTSAAAHKFYVAVFQMDYVPQKKVIQVTGRIFVDDLEATLNRKYGKKFYFGAKQELAGADEYLKKYFTEKIQVKVNGQAKALTFLGKEMEDDVLVCYYTLPAESNVKTLEVNNTTLMETFEDQQNIIHTNINRNKKSLLLTNSNRGGKLDY